MSTHLDELANLLRAAYTMERRAFESQRLGRESHYTPSRYWEGGSDGVRRGRKNIWREIARQVIRHRLDPVKFVAVQFRQRSIAPQPNMLLGKASLTRYQEWMEQQQPQMVQQLRVALQSELAALEAAAEKEQRRSPHWRREECLRVALLDPRVDVSPLFRYAFASRVGWGQLVQSLHAAAVWQYLAFPEAYDIAWRDVLPAGWSAVADRHRRRLADACEQEELNEHE